MNQTVLTINKPEEISANQIAGLLCTAIEGGVYYWAQCSLASSYRNAKPANLSSEDFGEWANFPQYCITHPDYKLSIYDYEEDKRYNLTLPKLKKGLKIMAKKFPRHFNNFINENEDAITGDVFLQCCIFGDVIYG